jgi:hypothetical protein
LCCSERGSCPPLLLGTAGGVATAVVAAGGEPAPDPGRNTGNSSKGERLAVGAGAGVCGRDTGAGSDRDGGFKVGGSGIAGRGTTGESGAREPS